MGITEDLKTVLDMIERVNDIDETLTLVAHNENNQISIYSEDYNDILSCVIIEDKKSYDFITHMFKNLGLT